jgi:hypothetical protein
MCRLAGTTYWARSIGHVELGTNTSSPGDSGSRTGGHVQLLSSHVELGTNTSNDGLSIQNRQEGNATWHRISYRLCSAIIEKRPEKA